jgi:hypothetical protein
LTLPAARLIFEAFIFEFPIQRYLAGFWCINVSRGFGLNTNGYHEKEKLLFTFVAGSAVQYSAGPTVHNGTGETVQQRYRISPIDHKDTV